MGHHELNIFSPNNQELRLESIFSKPELKMQIINYELVVIKQKDVQSCCSQYLFLPYSNIVTLNFSYVCQDSCWTPDANRFSLWIKNFEWIWALYNQFSFIWSIIFVIGYSCCSGKYKRSFYWENLFKVPHLPDLITTSLTTFQCWKISNWILKKIDF